MRGLNIVEDDADVGADFEQTDRFVGTQRAEGFASRRFDHVHGAQTCEGLISTTKKAGREPGTARLIDASLPMPD
jgi:hypothetical protein